MDLGLSEDQAFFQETTRKFLETEAPLTSVRNWAETPGGFDRAWWKRGAELGWTSLLLPEEHGGASLAGEGLLDLVIVAEEMGRLVSPGPLLPTNVVAAAVAAAGNAVQTGILPGIVAGETIAGWAYFESGASWQPDAVALRATPSGDGFVLDGTKSHVENGAEAQHFLVTARSGDGLTQFLLPAGHRGLTVTPMSSLDLVRRFAELRFDGVRVASSSVLGIPGQAAADVERQLQHALVLQCAETAGVIDRVFEFTLEYMFDRFSFGRPLASYQALKHRMADLKLWVEASHATVSGAARAVQDGTEDAGRLVRAAKSYIGDRATALIQECVQMHGGMGVTWEHDLHLYLRRATVNRMMYGAPDEQRAQIALSLGIDGDAR